MSNDTRPSFFQRIFNSRKYFFQFLFFDSANDGPAEAVAVFFASGAVGQEQSFFGKVQGAVAVTAVRLFFKGHGVSKGLAVVFAPVSYTHLTLPTKTWV